MIPSSDIFESLDNITIVTQRHSNSDIDHTTLELPFLAPIS